MLKLTNIEIKVMDHFHIVPNNFNGEGTLPTPTEVGWWVAGQRRGKDRSLHPFRDGTAILASLRRKLWDEFEDDCVATEETATWVLSHYFSLEELSAMSPDDAERFMKDWKYFCGYRKCDGWGHIYIYNAMRALRGEIILPKKPKDYFYIEKE